jgi:hypothetical protein
MPLPPQAYHPDLVVGARSAEGRLARGPGGITVNSPSITS